MCQNAKQARGAVGPSQLKQKQTLPLGWGGGEQPFSKDSISYKGNNQPLGSFIQGCLWSKDHCGSLRNILFSFLTCLPNCFAVSTLKLILIPGANFSQLACGWGVWNSELTLGNFRRFYLHTHTRISMPERLAIINLTNSWAPSLNCCVCVGNGEAVQC